MRIEINLTEEVAKAIQEKAEAQNHSRKSYIELLCINDVKKKAVSGGFGTKNCQTKIKVKWKTKN